MKLKIILFLSIFATCFLQAQDDFRVELLGMNAYNPPSSRTGWVITDNVYLGGVDFSFSNRLNDKIDLNYGSGFRVVNYSEIDYIITFPDDHDGMGGFDVFKSWIETNAYFGFVSGNVGLKWKTSTSRKHLYVKPSVEAWYSIGLLGKSAKVQESGTGFSEVGNPSINKSPKLFTIFGNAAVGFQFPIQKLDYFVEARGAYPFQKFFKPNDTDEGIKLTPIGLAIGCQF